MAKLMNLVDEFVFVKGDAPGGINGVHQDIVLADRGDIRGGYVGEYGSCALDPHRLVRACPHMIGNEIVDGMFRGGK